MPDPLPHKPRISIIGSGNVATHLARALDGHACISQVCSRNFTHAQELASRHRGCKAVENLADLDPTVDLCLIAVADDAIASVAQSLPKMQGLVAHTSGSTPIEALAGCSDQIGVFYPLQTFSKDAKVDLSAVTIFTEASNASALAKLDALAWAIAKEARHADSQQRKALHIAAVFGCNFANHLWTIADELLRREGLDLSVLEPLLRVTLDKALTLSPAKAQTGPAARGDQRVIADHLSRLTGLPHDIYSLLTTSILTHNVST